MKYKLLFLHTEWKTQFWADSVEDAANQLGANKTDLKIISRITENEFILKDVPIEFKSPLSQMAYERGHSAGENEVTGVLRGLVADLLPAITAFQERIELAARKARK